MNDSKKLSVFVKVLPISFVLTLSGCQTPGTHLQRADEKAASIIDAKQQEALGRNEAFTIETPTETLRRRLITEQKLSYSDVASLGTPYLKKIEHWPQDQDYLHKTKRVDPLLEDLLPQQVGDQTVQLNLFTALQVAAFNSRDYQSAKESVFRSALDLDLARDDFRNTFTGLLRSEINTNLAGDKPVTNVNNSATTSVSKKFKQGINFTASLGVDLVKLLSSDYAVSRGVFGDFSISIPLLRGAGRHIVTEPLQQAERNVVYAIWDFERFKRTFVVRVASEYLSVLQQIDQVDNAAENYKQLIDSARRAKRLAEAGRLPAIQVDQAIQDELSARARWISAQQSYSRALDNFKITLGLPVDAKIELAREDLDKLANARESLLENIDGVSVTGGQITAADTPIDIKDLASSTKGPYELPTSAAVKLGLLHRLDLRVSQGRVYDAQRAVTIAADALRAELTLLGSGSAGAGRSGAGAAGLDDADFRPEKGNYSALLSLDLPFERTSEQIAFRKSYINLESAVRSYQAQEDQVKLDVRNDLRNLVEFRESVRIQAQAVKVAKRRVASTNLFLQAGRAEIRDLLESQDALISAQNALTNALVSYRIAELSLQRDMGLLLVDEKGLWQEFEPSKLAEYLEENNRGN